MNQKRYDEIAGQLLATATGIEDAKRPGYTGGNTDVLHNFKSVAQRVGITTEQAWAVYFLKHVDAILSGMCKPDLPVAEALEGRFSDAINYLKLGWGIVNDKKETQQQTAVAYPKQPSTADELRRLMDLQRGLQNTQTLFYKP